MRRKRHSSDEIIRKLREAAGGGGRVGRADLPGAGDHAADAGPLATAVPRHGRWRDQEPAGTGGRSPPLEGLFAAHGVPRHIRSDNGPELIARAVRDWLERNELKAMYIEPGSPWQNGIIESFNGRHQDECLTIEAFYSPEEARVVIEDYRRYDRDRRPHSSLRYTTPKKHVAACVAHGGVFLAAVKTDRVDGAGGEAPPPLQTSPSTAHETKAKAPAMQE